MSSMSVSLGARALPAVKEAIEHAAKNPDHDPFIICVILYDPPEQRVTWKCHECTREVPS